MPKDPDLTDYRDPFSISFGCEEIADGYPEEHPEVPPNTAPWPTKPGPPRLTLWQRIRDWLCSPLPADLWIRN